MENKNLHSRLKTVISQCEKTSNNNFFMLCWQNGISVKREINKNLQTIKIKDIELDD